MSRPIFCRWESLSMVEIRGTQLEKMAWRVRCEGPEPANPCSGEWPFLRDRPHANRVIR